jgi:ADP-heptose:LPS heptosyltransferase
LGSRTPRLAPRKIVVFRALKLGDMLCAVPALRAIRAGFPDAEIVLVGLPWAHDFVDRYASYIDDFRVLPGYPGLPERPPDLRRLPAFFQTMRNERFDLAIQLPGSGRISNEVIGQFDAKIYAGFYEHGGIPPEPETFLTYPSRGLELRRLLRLVEHLGIPACGEALEFPISGDERAEARRLALSAGITSCDYVCIHGGASVPERRWPTDRFAEVADALARRGLVVVLTGTAEEAALTDSIARAMRAPSVDLVGKTPLGVLAALLGKSRLLVCNDTGVSHVADALRVPSVVISTGDNPERWAPTDRRLHRVVCRDSGVAVGEVIAQADDLLQKTKYENAEKSYVVAGCVDSPGRRPRQSCDHCVF